MLFHVSFYLIIEEKKKFNKKLFSEIYFHFICRRAIKDNCSSALGNELDSIIKWAHKAGFYCYFKDFYYHMQV